MLTDLSPSHATPFNFFSLLSDIHEIRPTPLALSDYESLIPSFLHYPRIGTQFDLNIIDVNLNLMRMNVNQNAFSWSSAS